jgi:hypothetical protein
MMLFLSGFHFFQRGESLKSNTLVRKKLTNLRDNTNSQPRIWYFPRILRNLHGPPHRPNSAGELGEQLLISSLEHHKPFEAPLPRRREPPAQLAEQPQRNLTEPPTAIKSQQ